MDMKKLHTRLDEATARMEAIVCIAGMLGDFAVAEPLEQLLEEDAEELRKCFPDMPPEVEQALNERDRDAFHEWAFDTGKLGFAVRFATPVMRPTGKGSHTYSWGSYYTRWVYGDTLAKAVDAGLAWVAEQRKAGR